jgi:glycosyltransferase involved in cell wall biosynthesis
MPYLVNPHGRIVAIDNKEQYDAYIKLPGYKPLSQDEQTKHIKQRIKMAEAQKEATDPTNNVYFSTVSQGGKDGYGISSTAIIKELQKQEIAVDTYYRGQKVAILFHNPYGIAAIESPYRIIYTMFESTKIPDDWVEFLKAADKVIVPSKWCKEVFAKSGIKAEVVPLGYDNTVYRYIHRERKETDTFTFLHYNAFNARKGFLELFKAWNKAFDKTEPVKLILKTTQSYSPLPITPAEYPNIEIIHGQLEPKDMQSLMAKADAFVFPSRGEGFGLTPLEAMATGLPTIVPNAHGISEYFNSDYMYEVAISGECPALYSRYKNQDVGKMVVCDIDDLARKMRYIYDHKQEAREKGIKAAEYVQQWTYPNTAQLLGNIINGALVKPIDVKRNITNVLTLEKIT